MRFLMQKKILSVTKDFTFHTIEEEMLNSLRSLFFKMHNLERNNAWNNSLNPEVYNYYFVGNWDFDILRLEPVINPFGGSKLSHSFIQPCQIEITYNVNKLSVNIYYTFSHYIGYIFITIFWIVLFLWSNLFDNSLPFIYLSIFPLIFIIDLLLFYYKANKYLKIIKKHFK